MKIFLSLILLIGASLAIADAPNSDTPSVRAVMFEWAFDKDGFIRHAQVISGYPSLDACRDALRSVMGRATVVEEGLTPQLLCQGVIVAPEQKNAKHDGSTTI